MHGLCLQRLQLHSHLPSIAQVLSQCQRQVHLNADCVLAQANGDWRLLKDWPSSSLMHSSVGVPVHEVFAYLP